MLNEDEDALLCDLSETYHIYDLQALPWPAMARLAAGLPLDSRIIRKMSGVTGTRLELMMAMAVDYLAALNYKFGDKHAKKPESVLSKLIEKPKRLDNELMKFSSIGEFEAARNKAFGGAEDG